MSKIYVTYLDAEFECDTFFPKLDEKKYQVIEKTLHENSMIEYDFNIYDMIYKNTN